MTKSTAQPAVGVVDVWRVPIPGPSEPSTNMLSADEVGRLERRLSQTDRRRALAAWTARREILARYLGCAPRDVPLQRAEDGRPFLQTSGSTLDHSMAHSGDWMMLAVSRLGPVGLDLEQVDASLDVGRVAARFFAPEDAAAMAGLPRSEQAAAFFRAWTEKEAYLKGIGGGVPSRLRSVRVSLDSRAGSRAVGDWVLHSVEAPTGYVACLAVQAAGVRVRTIDFPEPIGR
ncbi:MAG: 4'-phosphopantetheinyl transferase superfamily protein [Candidatus Bipolaricaulis sp.]|nr:4'-phosphopantetheinyl transferase superfamily protein [Candidatus Bipolaricaulis sp.]